MSVSQATQLRKSFRENSVEYKVSKNTLTKIAAKNAGYDESKLMIFVGQIGIAYADSDPTAPAKVIKDFIKENEDCLDVVGLIVDGEFYEAENISSLQVCHLEKNCYKICHWFKFSMTKISTMLNSVMTKMVTALNA